MAALTGTGPARERLEVLLEAHHCFAASDVPRAYLPVADRPLLDIALECVARGARRLGRRALVVLTCPAAGLALEEYEARGMRFDLDIELLPVDATRDGDALTARAALGTGALRFGCDALPALLAFARGEPAPDAAASPLPGGFTPEADCSSPDAPLAWALNAFWATEGWPFHAGRREGGSLIGHTSAEGATVAVRRSYLGAGVEVVVPTVALDCALMADSRVGWGCHLERCIVLPGGEVPDETRARGRLLGLPGWLAAESRRLRGRRSLSEQLRAWRLARLRRVFC